MNKRIFSRKLYTEGLRQLKLIGIISLVILCIQVIAIPLWDVIECSLYGFSTSTVTFPLLNPLLYAVPYVIAPLLAFSAFSFLNKRKSSDFYHSIHETRTCLFISFTAAVLTWIIIICVSTTLLGVLFDLIFGEIFVMNFANIFTNMLGILVSSIYCAVITILAISLTGIVITNITLALLFLFVPDYLTFIFLQNLSNSLPFVNLEDYAIKVMPVGFSVFNGFNTSDFYTAFGFDSLGRIICTLVLTVIVLVISLTLFKKRKSESAGNPAINKYMQAAIRVLICMLVCMVACGLIFNQNKDYLYYDTAAFLFTVILIYIGALVAYFLYELITKRSFKALLRTIPTLGIVVILNIAVIIGLNGVYNSILGFCPDENEIDYVRLSTETDRIYSLHDYLDYKCNDIKITDPEVLSIISENLQNDIEDINSKKYYAYAYYDRLYVAISVNGTERYRYIKFNQSELETFSSSLRNCDEYAKIYKKLPKALSIEGVSGKHIEKGEIEKFYNIYRSEVAQTDFDTWYSLVSREYHGGETVSVLDNLYISVADGLDTLEFSVPIFMQLRDTANAYVDMVYDDEGAKQILDIMSDTDNIYSIEFCMKNVDGGIDYLYFDESNFEDNLDVINELIDKCSLIDEYNENDILIQVYLWSHEEINVGDNGNKHPANHFESYFKFNGTNEDMLNIINQYK